MHPDELESESPPPLADEQVDSGSLYSMPAIPANFQNDCGIKYDLRTDSSVEIKFQNMVVRTTERAVLLNIMHPTTGEMLEEWFPKKLCSNLDEAAGTIRCWTVFAEDTKKHLWEDS